MKKKIWIYLLLLVALFFMLSLFRHNYTETQAIKKNELISETYNKYHTLLVSYTDRINKKEEGILEELERKLANSTNPLDIGTYKNALSYYYIATGNYDLHKELAINSIEEYYKSEFSGPLILTTYNYMISNSLARKDYSFGLKCSYASMEILDNMDYSFISDSFEKEIEIGLSCNFINIFVNSNLDEKAAKYYDKISCIDESDPLYIKNERLILFAKLIYSDAIKDYDTALKYAYKYHELAVQSNSPSIEGMRLNIAISLLKNNMTDEALPHIIAAEKHFVKIPHQLALGNVYTTYGDYYLQKSDYKKAFNYFKDAYELFNSTSNTNTNTNFMVDEISALEKLIETVINGNLNINTDNYIKEYINLNKHSIGNEEPANLFTAMEEINQKSYESKLILTKKEQESLKYTSKIRSKIIFYLVITLVLFVILTFVLFKEIKARKISEEKLKEFANTDALTKCHSRGYGFKILNDLIKEKKTFTLALIDLDDFKKINDTYGHLVGDEALKLLGSFLREKLKNTGIAIRYGGEEFIIVFEDMDIDKSSIILEDLRLEFSTLTFYDNLSCTLSMGAKEWNGNLLTKFLNDVDSLLYEAKHSGKNKLIR